MSTSSLDSTYGAWLLSLFFEALLYGVGTLQVYLYFLWWPADSWSIKAAVIGVMLSETVQVSIFFRSTFFRLVENFGVYRDDLIWSDSIQLSANYLTAFMVQIYFASRIYLLKSESSAFHRSSAMSIYCIVFLAFTQISAGIAQTIWLYQIHSYTDLDKTKATAVLQTTASLFCDVAITFCLCLFLAQNKCKNQRTERVLQSLIVNAVNRGIITALASAFTMILFLVYPNTFWFFLPLSPTSKLYMNSMLATLNMRQHIRDKFKPNRRTIQLDEFGDTGYNRNRDPLSASEVVKSVECG